MQNALNFVYSNLGRFINVTIENNVITFYNENEKQIGTIGYDLNLDNERLPLLSSIYVNKDFKEKHYSIIMMYILSQFFEENGMFMFDLTDDSDRRDIDNSDNLYIKVGCSPTYKRGIDKEEYYTRVCDTITVADKFFKYFKL